MANIVLYNPTSTPVVYTDEGHVVGGTERVTVDRLDKTGTRAVEHGRLTRETPSETTRARPGASETPTAPEVS